MNFWTGIIGLGLEQLMDPFWYVCFRDVGVLFPDNYFVVSLYYAIFNSIMPYTVHGVEI